MWIKVIGAISYSLLVFLCGLPHIWGNISLYLYSYYYDYDYDNDFGLLNFAMLLELFLIFLGYLAYQVFLKQVPHHLILTAAIPAFIVCGFLTIIIKNVYLFAFVYHAVMGFIIGVLQTIPFEQGPRFFTRRTSKARFRDFLQIFFGFNAFFFNLVGSSILNPDNESATITYRTYMYFPPSVSCHFPEFMEFVAIVNTVLGACVLAGVYLVRRYRVEELEEVLIEEDEASLEVPMKKGEPGLLKVLFSGKFARIFSMAIFSSIFVEYFLIYYKEIGMIHTNKDRYMSVVGAFAFLFFTLGRVFWKLLSNAINNHYLPLTIVIIIQSLIGFLFKFAAALEGLLFMILCLVLFIGGGQYSLYEKLVKAHFLGSRHRKTLTVAINFAFTVSLLIVIVAHYIFFENIGYNNLIIVMTLLGFLSFIFFL